MGPAHETSDASVRLLNEETRPGALHYKILFFCWAGWLFDFYDLMLFSTVQGAVRAGLGLTSDAQVSTVIGTSLASTALGGILFGWLADRVGRRPVLQATIL